MWTTRCVFGTSRTPCAAFPLPCSQRSVYGGVKLFAPCIAHAVAAWVHDLRARVVPQPPIPPRIHLQRRHLFACFVALCRHISKFCGVVANAQVCGFAQARNCCREPLNFRSLFAYQADAGKLAVLALVGHLRPFVSVIGLSDFWADNDKFYRSHAVVFSRSKR